MTSSARYLNPAEAARRLGVSVKALRLYERRGLIAPPRSAAGWRAYGPAEMARAAEIAALRRLGLGLAQAADALSGDKALETILAAHEAALENRLRQAAEALTAVRDHLARLAKGGPEQAAPAVAFDLPWPWGGERFVLRDLPPLAYITGPLGSGKTRLAMRLAETLPGAAFLGLDRLAEDGAAARARPAPDSALAARVEAALARLVADGAQPSTALTALLAGLEAEGPAALVVDMVEQGLEQAAQQALMAELRRRGPGARPLFLLTRSSAILDLAALGPGEAVFYCPANHSPPLRVEPRPGAPGYEALATCLASPEVRARTAGVVAWRPPQAA